VNLSSFVGCTCVSNHRISDRKASCCQKYGFPVFSLPFIFIAMLVASNGWFGWKLLFLGTLAAVTARNFAMGVNRYLDRDIDKIGYKHK